MARFPQLDRLAEYSEWRDFKREPVKRRRNPRTIALDEIFTEDGVIAPPPEQEDE